MLPIENIQEFRSVGAMNVTSGQSGRTKEPLACQGPSNGAVIFYDGGFSAKLRSCRFVAS